MRPSRLVFVAAAIALTLIAAALASAGTGSSAPNGALPLSVGSHPFSTCADVDQEFFAFPALINGDAVTLDLTASGRILDFLAPGTDDFNWQSANPIDYTYTAGNGKYRLFFNANQGNGRYIVYADCRYTGTDYDLLVESVRHVVRADLVPRPTKLNVRGSFRAHVVGGDGAPLSDPALRFTLQARWGGAVHTLGNAAPQAGVLAIPYRFPASLRGKVVAVWASAPQTDTYLAASTTKVAVRIR